jgi:predicted RNase H-like HicB family nuclease
MTRKYSLVIEGDPGSYSAYVPELPTILITGQSLDEVTVRATEAIRVYWDAVRTDVSPTSMLREIEVELPA